jgi:hypothetical protein
MCRVDDALFSVCAKEPVEEFRRIEALSTYMARLLRRTRPTMVELGNHPLREARSYVLQASEFAFCLTELLPLLRSLSGQDVNGAKGVPDVKQECRDLQVRAAELERRLKPRRLTSESMSQLEKALGNPCAVVGRNVIPLERVSRPRPAGRNITLAGGYYAYCLDDTRELAHIVAGATAAAQRQARRALLADAELIRVASALVADAKSILGRFHPENRGKYLIVHQDQHHQLQHNAGHWVLGRGPLKCRTSTERIYVGLHIRGRDRDKRLVLDPRPTLRPDDFWTKRGEPARGGLCVGERDQFRWLRSKRVTDAEAIVFWLDAGVVLATGQSDFHRLWRQQRARIAQPRSRRSRRR